MTVRAIFEDGVFRPLAPIDLPNRCEVVFEPRQVDASVDAARQRVYALLSESFDGGPPDLAARVDEHQP